jgi:hypothetical protein
MHCSRLRCAGPFGLSLWVSPTHPAAGCLPVSTRASCTCWSFPYVKLLHTAAAKLACEKRSKVHEWPLARLVSQAMVVSCIFTVLVFPVSAFEAVQVASSELLHSAFSVSLVFEMTAFQTRQGASSEPLHSALRGVLDTIRVQSLWLV